MQHQEHLVWLKDLTAQYPRFADGRINYTNQRNCPVVNCVVVHDDYVLLAQRSTDVLAYPLVWSGISGFVDTHQPLSEVIFTELMEEVGIERHQVANLDIFERIYQPDHELDRHWHVYPALALLHQKPDIMLNWENEHAQWVHYEQVTTYDLMPGFYAVYERAMQQLHASTR